jgi:hypothetical protein
MPDLPGKFYARKFYAPKFIFPSDARCCSISAGRRIGMRNLSFLIRGWGEKTDRIPVHQRKEIFLK